MSYEFPRDPLSGPVVCHRSACKATVEPLCDGCRFWGTFEIKHGETTRQTDFYTCNVPRDLAAYVQIVVRFGDDGPHYTSGEFLAADLMRWKPGLELFKPVYAYVYRLSRDLPLE